MTVNHKKLWKLLADKDMKKILKRKQDSVIVSFQK